MASNLDRAAAATTAQSLHLWGFTAALIGAVAFSGKAILAKLMYRHGADGTLVLFWRMLLAWPFFLLMAWWAGRGAAPLPRATRIRIAGLGFFGYYLASALDFWGLQFISASLERLILYLNPSFVMVIGLVLHGRRPSSRQWWALALAYAGVALAFGHEAWSHGQASMVGVALVLGSALSYAIYLSGSGELVRDIGALRLIGSASSVACALAVAQALVLKPWAQLAATPQAVLELSVVNALFCTVAPMLLVMMAIERLGAASAAQIGMVGPLSTVVLAWLLLGEALTPWMVAGTALVLIGVALLAKRG